MLRRMLYSADRRLVEAAESTERMSAMWPLNLTGTRPGRMLISTLDEACHIIIYKGKCIACVLSHSVEVKVTPEEKLRVWVTHRCPRTHGCPAAQRGTWRTCWLVAAAPQRRWWENTEWILQGEPQGDKMKHRFSLIDFSYISSFRLMKRTMTWCLLFCIFDRLLAYWFVLVHSCMSPGQLTAINVHCNLMKGRLNALSMKTHRF